MSEEAMKATVESLWAKLIIITFLQCTSYFHTSYR